MLKKSGLLAVLAVMLFLSSCATRYYPEPSEYVTVTDDFAVVQEDGISFAAKSRVWTREPHKLNDYFTTYYIVVINSSDRRVTINPGDIKLLDEDRSQFDALTYVDVAEILLRDDFIKEKHGPFRSRDYQVTDDRVLARAYLMQDSFHYGEIMPNARKTGYIFFSRLSPKNQKATILFRDREINFIRR